VVPKAPAFPEDEKTTLESGWEEEPSTTIEQGEIADKLRALQSEPVRNRNANGFSSGTNDSVVDEPTVDDQHANAVIAAIPPPSLAVARLAVTQGNDTGQHLEIAPGKTYTIGRAIDNDLVLTDIAVSRKHFDLRQEAGAWVIVDRGSGNGTIVNGNLEDQPFVLANADVVEIGNTTFRFEQANAPPRIPRPIAGRYDIAPDEEEQSTVAGKPLRNDEVATPAAMPPPPRLQPKTAPPPALPAPLPRLRNPGPTPGPPLPPPQPNGARAQAAGLPGLPPHMARAAMPTEPPKPQAQLQPVPPPMSQPQLLQLPRAQPPQLSQQQLSQQQLSQQQLSQQQLSQQQLSQQQLSQPLQQMLPQPPPGLRPPQALPMPVTTRPMPQLAQRPAQLAPQAPTMLAADAMAARSALPTTIPGQGPPAPLYPQLPYSYPSVADIQQHAQMLVVGNGPPRDATSTALVQPTPYGVPQPTMTPSISLSPTLSRKTKLLLGGAALTLLAAIATIAIMKSAESKQKPTTTESSGAGTGSDDEASPDEPQKPDTTSATKAQPTQPETTKPEATKVAQGDPGKAAKPEPTKPEATKPEPTKPEPTKPEPTKPEPIKPEPIKPEPIKPEATKPEPTKPEPEPTKPTRDARDSRDAKDSKKTPKTTATSPKTTTSTRSKPTQVATATRSDTSGARNRAIALYREKKFTEAAALLNQTASSLSGNEATDLRTLASVYQQLGAAYNRGMSPGAKAVDAYNDLRRALNLDSGSAAGEFTSEIRTKLAQVAAKAAISFYARKDYIQAFQAVRTAEGNGITNGDTALVREKLEQAAKELYDQAAKEINASPDAAKQKLRQIKGMVDGKSPTLAKANQLLSGN
jgi:pSer/pThr/pTyr-binding forkhead associated (FHA) protein/outer membrane biosynthesis protein TonB